MHGVQRNINDGRMTLNSKGFAAGRQVDCTNNNIDVI